MKDEAELGLVRHMDSTDHQWEWVSGDLVC